MVAQWQSHQQYATTHQRRLDEISDTTIRGRILLALAEAAGCFEKYAGGGAFCEFPILISNPAPEEYSDYVPPNYSQPDMFRTGRLPWGAYHHGKHLGRLTLNMNQGVEQAIDLFEASMREVDKAFTQRWPEKWYQNGDSFGPNALHGFYTLGAKYINATAAASQGFEGKVRLLSGSYAGLAMDLGQVSAVWAGDDGYPTVQSGTWAGYNWWPMGTGEPGYDYCHPVIVNTTAGAAAGAPVSWGPNAAFDEVYAEQMLDFGIMASRRLNGGPKKHMDLILCGMKPMSIIRNRMSATYRTLTVMNSSNVQSQGLETGFPVHMHNGSVLAEDFDMPNTTDLIGLRLEQIRYHPVAAYDTKATQIMSPWSGPAPGGTGELIGGFSHGQLVIMDPRSLVFWRPLG